MNVTPGYKTTEFWLSLLTVLLGALLASGAVADGSMAAQIVGGVMAVLGQLGYTKARADVKANGGAPASAVPPAPNKAPADGPEIL